jgi:hypothetical protein
VSIPHDFCEKLLKLLRNLARSFSERKQLTDWMQFFEKEVLGIPVMEKWVIDKWHFDMTYNEDGSPRATSMYSLTKARKIKDLLDAGLWVFDAIDAASMYHDPKISEADRENICRYFDVLNGLSQLFAAVPTELMDMAGDVARETSGKMPINADTIQALTQRMIGCDPAELTRNPAAFDKLLGWAGQLATSFQTPDALEGLGAMLNDTLTSQAMSMNMEDVFSVVRQQMSSGGALAAAAALGSAGGAGGPGGLVPPGLDLSSIQRLLTELHPSKVGGK